MRPRAVISDVQGSVCPAWFNSAQSRLEHLVLGKCKGHYMMGPVWSSAHCLEAEACAIVGKQGVNLHNLQICPTKVHVWPAHALKHRLRITKSRPAAKYYLAS